MSHSRRIAAQWLETDQAFGLAEIPVPRPSPPPAAPAAPRQPVAKPAQSARPLSSRPAAAPASPTPAPPVRDRLALVPEQGADAMARARKTASVEIPGIPTGNIADLPPLTRDEKIAALKKLETRVHKELTPFLSDISTKIVFGEGDPDAPVMFVGEGPGSEEDRLGRPFVGRSGQLLDKQITAMGFQRSQVYIANVVKLRAADPDPETGRLKDRPPHPEEVARGLPLLQEQIAIIRPRVIVTLGAPAIRYLTGETQGVMKIRGTWHDFRGIPVMPTYHPSFLLRAYTEENRRKVWEDLLSVLKKLGKKPPTKAG